MLHRLGRHAAKGSAAKFLASTGPTPYGEDAVTDLRCAHDVSRPEPPRLAWRRLRALCGALALLAAGALLGPAHAASRFAVASNDWNNTATWSSASCAGASGASAPVAGDAVTICTNITVTVTANAAANTVDVIGSSNPGATTNGITINSGFTLAVTGAVTTNSPSANNAPLTIDVGAGTLTAASIAIAGTTSGSSRFCTVTVSTGTITTTGAITISNNTGSIFTSAGTVNVGGDFLATAGGAVTLSAGKVNFNGSGNQTMGPYTYNNVELNKSANSVFVAGGTGTTTTVNGTLNVITGTLNFASSLGTKTFKALVTIDGSWANVTNSALFFEGGLKFNGAGSFSSGTGQYNFRVNSQEIGGSAAMTFSGTVAINDAITVTNSNTNAAGITATGAITGISGTNWTQAANSYLNVSGAFLTTAEIGRASCRERV